jgi:hypothetical protein
VAAARLARTASAYRVLDRSAVRASRKTTVLHDARSGLVR